MKFRCPLCGRKIGCDDSWVGQNAVCPACGGKIVIPKAQDDDVDNLLPTYQEIDQLLRQSTDLRSRLFSFSNDDGSFKTPLLSNILYYGSVCAAVLLFIAIIVLIFIGSYVDSIAKGVFSTVFWTILNIIKYIILALGISQLIYAICKICYHAERIDERMSNQKK